MKVSNVESLRELSCILGLLVDLVTTQGGIQLVGGGLLDIVAMGAEDSPGLGDEHKGGLRKIICVAGTSLELAL